MLRGITMHFFDEDDGNHKDGRDLTCSNGDRTMVLFPVPDYLKDMDDVSTEPEEGV